jgi:hypothetical protein
MCIHQIHSSSFKFFGTMADNSVRVMMSPMICHVFPGFSRTRLLAGKGLGLEFSLWAMAGEESAQLFSF